MSGKDNSQNEKKQKRDLKNILKNILPLIIFIAAMAVLTIIFLPEIRRFGTEEGREEFKAFIDEIGFLGWLVTLGIQLLQIFVALIPGEPVEVMLGFVWGPWLGTFTCLLGIFIGTLVIYFLVRNLGIPFIKRAIGEKDFNRYKFLSDPKKIELTVFILFFIPGTPKDALTYIAPIAPIHPLKYILIATLARIPSVVTSTLLGGSIAEGDYLMAVIVFSVTALISVAGIIFGNKYMAYREKGRLPEENNSERPED